MRINKFLLLCAACFYFQAHTCSAIDSASTLDPALIFDEPVQAGPEKKHVSPPPEVSNNLPDVPIAEIFLHENTIETAKISKNVINWISASENIVSIRYADEVENLVADYDGKNCYLRYSGKKVLVYINTENAVYPTWLEPTDISAVHLTLKKNNPLAQEGDSSIVGQKGTTYSNNKETNLIEMVKFAYSSEIEPIAVDKLEKLNVIEGTQGYRYKSIKFEDGMYVNIYLFRLDSAAVTEKVDIKETDFLLPELCYYPIGMALEYPDLRKDRFTRVFVVGAEKPVEGENGI